MKIIETNLQSAFTDIRTIFNILVESPTWKFKIRCLTKILSDLKRNGENCLNLIDELEKKCDHFKKEINNTRDIIINHMKMISFKSNEYVSRPIMQFLSSFIVKFFHYIIQVTGTELVNKRLICFSDTKDNHRYNDIDEVIQLLMQLDEQWNHFISGIIVHKFRLKLLLDEKINTLIDLINVNDTCSIASSEENFVLKMIKTQMIDFYQKFSSIIMILNTFIELSNDLIINQYFSREEHEHYISIDHYIFKKNILQTQSRELFLKNKAKYLLLFEDHHKKLNNFINRLHSI